MATILVIEDEDDFLETICEVLELEGHKVIKAKNGEDGIILAQQKLPDLILCDYLMPKKNGFQVIEEIKISPEMCNIPFIFLSVYDDVESIVKGFDLGAQDYISKTTDNKVILARVKAQLALRKN